MIKDRAGVERKQRVYIPGGSCCGVILKAMCCRDAPATFTCLLLTCVLTLKVRPLYVEWGKSIDGHSQTAV